MPHPCRVGLSSFKEGIVSNRQSRWDRRYLDMCELIGSWSKDQSTKVGCVIVGDAGQVLATGYNGFPRRVNDNIAWRHQRPQKYLFAEHGERNAIYNAARDGVGLEGATLYVGWPPCADCARAIIQSGIWTVVLGTDVTPERWRESCEAGSEMFAEAGVTVVVFDG